MHRCVLALGAVLGMIACGPPAGPHVRFATASPQAIRDAQASGRPVWYEFEPGDSVPMILGVGGVFEAVADPPPRMIARRRFAVVIHPNGQTFFSVEGGGLITADQFARWAIAFEATDTGGAAGVILMLGRPQDLPR